jgi:hypothetical protein
MLAHSLRISGNLRAEMLGALLLMHELPCVIQCNQKKNYCDNSFVSSNK